MMRAERFDFLLTRFKADLLTKSEWEEWRQAVQSGEFDTQLKEEFLNIVESGAQHSTWNAAIEEDIWNEILHQRHLAKPLSNNSSKTSSTKKGLLLPFQNHLLKYTAVAASLLLVLTCYWLMKPAAKISSQVQIEKQPLKPNDIGPGGNRAILTLANGTHIVLDSAANGLIAMQSGVKILKFNGRLTVYPGKKGSEQVPDSNAVAFNTISTPRGGQYQLVLPDGSKVWLNAASSLKFPTVFNSNERQVELTGEGYFEVTKNAKMPFSVIVNHTKIAVLGTHFNVMAYTDEKTMNTTLLEGAVTVTDGDLEKKLIPGQQAILNSSVHRLTVTQADIPKAMAWKNGLFEFDHTDLATIMRQLARWYDIEIIYETTADNSALGGSISRNLSLKEVLNMLEANGINHFKIEGKKIFVLS
jgi:ferric-dicitrate binding protein FerR (iron transport regulator)